MKVNTISLFIVMLTYSFGCTDDGKILPDQKKDVDVKSGMIESNNTFAFNILSRISQNEGNAKNIFISPLSIYSALSMAANGANGKTYEAFENTLSYPYQGDENFQKLSELYQLLQSDNENITIEIANSLWADDQFEVKQKYKDETVEYFHAEVNQADFRLPGTVDIINGWIEEKTHNKIQKMLSGISPDEVLFLINAIYFKADWKYEFNPENNQDMSFSPENGSSVEVEYMTRESDLKYFSNDLFGAIKLPYIDSNYSMVILLPNMNKTSEEIIDSLNSDLWKEMKEGFQNKTVTLNLPKFKFEYGVKNINSELIDLGLGIAFTNKADFTNISDTKLAISRVLHKAFIEVNEKGSEAAAVTVVGFVTTSVDPNHVYFNVNRPFIFAICEESTNTVLFIGRVALPEYQ